MLQGKPNGGPTRTPGPRKWNTQATLKWPGIQSPATGGQPPGNAASSEANPTPLPKVNFAALGLAPHLQPAGNPRADSVEQDPASQPTYAASGSAPLSHTEWNEQPDAEMELAEASDSIEPQLGAPHSRSARGARKHRRRARGLALLWLAVACASFIAFTPRRSGPDARGASAPSGAADVPPATALPAAAGVEQGASEHVAQPSFQAANAQAVTRKASAAPVISRKRGVRSAPKKAKRASKGFAARAKLKRKKRAAR